MEYIKLGALIAVEVIEILDDTGLLLLGFFVTVYLFQRKSKQ